MKNKRKESLYHYTDSGLDYIYLMNGYDITEDPEFGVLVSIHDVDGLNKTIAQEIVESPKILRGQEVRFMRSQLKLSQTQMGLLMGCDLRTIQRWEKERNEQIPAASDRFLKFFYTAHVNGNEIVRAVSQVLKEVQDAKHHPKPQNKTKAKSAPPARLKFSDTSKGWLAAA